MKKVALAWMMVLMLLPLVVSGADSIVFGPEAFDRTEGSPNVYDESFDSTGGLGFLVVFNGDDEQDSRVDSGTISVNGKLVVKAGDLTEEVDQIIEPVNLDPSNTLQITLDGTPGGYIIVMVVTDKKFIPEFTAGRLHLAWTSISDPGITVDLRLKNGSPRFQRHFKARFYNEDGTLAAVSERMTLADHGSLHASVRSLLPAGSTWQSGSLEILFVGRGGGRILGYAIQNNASLQTETSIPLQWGGIRHHREIEKKKRK